jgi:hypothetical protein
MTKWLKNFLNKLAKATDKQYGDKVPDCCDETNEKK